MCNAKLTTGETVQGYWMPSFDDWMLVTESNGLIPFDSIAEYDVVPWLPTDHFCQPYKLGVVHANPKFTKNTN
jgi:hypothetical protein